MISPGSEIRLPALRGDNVFYIQDHEETQASWERFVELGNNILLRL